MISKRIATSCIALTIAMAPISRAAADGDAIVGGIIGGIIGGAIVNESQKNRTVKRTYVRPSTSGISSAQREANRETQIALNYFGFPVGSPDGVIGRRSRAAISEYQATLGYSPTGQLTDYERSLLIGSYHRAISGGATTAQQIATNPMGVRGLLLGYRDEALGIRPQQPVGQMAVAPAAPVPEAPQTEVVVRPAEPALPLLEAATEPEAPAASPSPGLPSFFGGASAQASLASHCNRVSLMTNTNGGFTTVANMQDPMQALGEQFCLARTYAISEGEDLATKVPGFTPQQIAEQCAGFGPAMKDQISALSLKPADAVMKDVEGFALSAGMAPAQLAATAKICLSVGYRTDNMDVAVGSALILATLGERAYGELMGHHLAQGIGAAQRPDLALGWYEMGLDALTEGGRAVFAPGQPERTDLIRKAAYTIGGKADQAALMPAAPVPAALPTFAAPDASQQASTGAVTAVPDAQPVIATSSDPAVSGSGGKGLLPFAASLPSLIFRD